MDLVTTFTICDFFKTDPNLVRRGQNALDSDHLVSAKYGGDGRAVGRIQSSYEQKVYDIEVGITAKLPESFVKDYLYLKFSGNLQHFSYFSNNTSGILLTHSERDSVMVVGLASRSVGRGSEVRTKTLKLVSAAILLGARQSRIAWRRKNQGCRLDDLTIKAVSHLRRQSISMMQANKNTIPYLSLSHDMVLSQIHITDQKICRAHCGCPNGQFQCHHMAAVLLWLCKNITRTDIECQWIKPRKQIESAGKRISQIWPNQGQGISVFF